MEVKQILTEYPRVYQLIYDDGVKSSVFAIDGTLNNCQTYTIDGIDELIYRDECRKYLIGIHKYILKSQVLLDISYKWFDKLKTIIPESDYIFANEYKNGTGARMVMVLAKTKSLKEE